MSYIGFVGVAAKRISEVPIPEFLDFKSYSYLKLSWNTLELLAKDIGYEVIESGFDRAIVRIELRGACNFVGRLLYQAPLSSVESDIHQLIEKDREYGGSWQRRGGPGAFFAACRKWDRIEEQMKKHVSLENAFKNDTRAEGILDDFGDLRRYLILWEAYRLWKEHS